MTETNTELTILTFRVGKKLMCLSISDINEIIEPVTPTHVPVTDKVLEGFISLRNQVLPLVRLSELFGASSISAELFEEKYLIAQNGDLTAALHVDAVGETQTCTSQSLLPYEPGTTDSSLFSGQIIVNGTSIPLVDLHQLFATIAQKNTQIRKQAGYSLS